MKYLLMFLIVVFSYSKTIVATYKAKYGWFGTIAISKAIYKIDKNNNYKIMITVQTKGIVASMTHDLEQTYISEGKIVDNVLVPIHYIMDIKKHGDDYYRIYIFDHKNKTVLKKRFKNGKFTKQNKYYYAPDDILSLYWNLPVYLKEKKDIYTFYAIGGRKNDGRVDVSFPNKDELKKLQKTFVTKGLYVKLNLYNKVFAGDKGILYLVINPNNWVTLAGMVKNVLKIGNLKGKIDKFSIDSEE